MKGGQTVGAGVFAAANLAPSATRTAVHGHGLDNPDLAEGRAYEAEQREWARNEFERELRFAGDGPSEAAYGSGWGSRGRW